MTVDTADPLVTQARLSDIRTRILARVPVTPAEMRDLLADIRRDRDNATRAARSAAATRRRQAAQPTAAAPAISIDTLFGSDAE